MLTEQATSFNAVLNPLGPDNSLAQRHCPHKLHGPLGLWWSVRSQRRPTVAAYTCVHWSTSTISPPKALIASLKNERGFIKRNVRSVGIFNAGNRNAHRLDTVINKH
jgi:hypothetical protein